MNVAQTIDNLFKQKILTKILSIKKYWIHEFNQIMNMY